MADSKFSWPDKFTHTVNDMPDEDAIVFVRAVINYGTYGALPEEELPYPVNAMFALAKEDLDFMTAAREAGRGGGRPRRGSKKAPAPEPEAVPCADGDASENPPRADGADPVSPACPEDAAPAGAAAAAVRGNRAEGTGSKESDGGGAEPEASPSRECAPSGNLPHAGSRRRRGQKGQPRERALPVAPPPSDDACALGVGRFTSEKVIAEMNAMLGTSYPLGSAKAQIEALRESGWGVRDFKDALTELASMAEGDPNPEERWTPEYAFQPALFNYLARQTWKKQYEQVACA